MPRLVVLVMLLLLAAFTLPAGHAQNAVHRCMGSDGTSVYGDQPCSDLHADDRPAPGNSDGSGHREVIARTCARKPEELLSDVRNALETQDVNHLAGSYLWTGMGSREAFSLMNRLSAFSARPLIDAQLVSSQPMLDSTETYEESVVATPELVPEDGSAPEAPARSAPDLIRIDQTRSANDAASATSYFRIVPAAGCLWISF